MAGAALPVGIHGLTLDRFVHDGRSRSTWCAFESIGIPAALRLDATTHTDCPTGRRAVRVGIVGGIPDDGNIALWLPDPTDGLHQHIDVAPSAGHHRRSRERSDARPRRLGGRSRRHPRADGAGLTIPAERARPCDAATDQLANASSRSARCRRPCLERTVMPSSSATSASSFCCTLVRQTTCALRSSSRGVECSTPWRTPFVGMLSNA